MIDKLKQLIAEYSLETDQVPNQFCIRTVSGKVIDFFDPDPDQFDINDICIALGQEQRFGGHKMLPNSVAQHSVIISRLTNCPEGLFHDAEEAYTKDIPKPLKNAISHCYEPIADNFRRKIFNKFGLDMGKLEMIKQYDKLLYVLEENALRNGKVFALTQLIRELIPEAKYVWWPPDYAEQMFRNEANKYL